jgi:hypothetical protein
VRKTGACEYMREGKAPVRKRAAVLASRMFDRRRVAVARWQSCSIWDSFCRRAGGIAVYCGTGRDYLDCRKAGEDED